MGNEILRSDSAQWPQIISSFHKAKRKPFKCWTQEGRKGLMRESFFFFAVICDATHAGWLKAPLGARGAL